MKHKLSRLTALMLAVVMTVSMLLIPVEAASFRDVSDKAWYKAAVDYVHERGWMAGVSDTTFAPNTEVTRGMFVTVLARYAKAGVDNANAAFADTGVGRWYTGAAAWAAEQGIVSGVGNGCFAPNRSITRQDLATILYQFIKKQDYKISADADRTFADMESVADYAREAVGFCAAAGLMVGDNSSNFNPKATATRAELAQILMKLDILANYVNKPAQSFDGEGSNGMVVSIEAPEGAFPEGAEMSVAAVIDSQSLLVLQKLAEGREILAASDISFSKDGVSLQPGTPVQVQLAVNDLQSIENPTVVHVKHDGTVEYVDAELISVNRAGTEKALRFEAADFSVYAVVSGNADQEKSRLKVQLWKLNPNPDAETGEPRYVKDQAIYVTRQDVNKLGTIIPDGESPVADAGEIFCGWFFDDDQTAAGAFDGTTDKMKYDEEDADGQHTMDAARAQVRAYLADTTNVIIDSETTVNIYPIILNYFIVSYVNEIGTTTLNSEIYYSKEDTYRDYEIFQQYTPEEQGYRFIGWQKDDGDNTIYQNRDVIDLTVPATTLQAQVQEGFWLSFVESPSTNDNRYKGATYNPPVFCPKGQIPANARPATPKLAGYDFVNWFETFNAGNTIAQDSWTTQFNFSSTLRQDTTIYAKWTPMETVPYTLILWRQSINDDRYAPDAQKTYDYAFSVTRYAAPGTAISALDLSYFQTTHNWLYQGTNYPGYINSDPDTNLADNYYSFTGFVYNTTKGVVSTNQNVTTVLSNGTTVVNLYWDRMLIKLNFKVQGYTTRTTYSAGDTYYPGPDGNFASVTRFTVNSSNYWYCYQMPSFASMAHDTGDSEIGENNTINNTNYFCNVNGTLNYIYWVENYTNADADLENYTGWIRQSSSTATPAAYEESAFDTYPAYFKIGSTTSNTLPSGKTFYQKSSSNTTWRNCSTMTGLYGQRLSRYGYALPTSLRWYLSVKASSGSTYFISILDTFPTSQNDNPPDDSVTNFYGYSETMDANVYHILQNVDGETWPNSNKYITVPTQSDNGMVFRPSLGFTSKEYRVNLSSSSQKYYLADVYTTSGSGNSVTYTVSDWGSAKSYASYENGVYWSEWIPKGTLIKYGSFTQNEDRIEPINGKIEFRYSRDSYRINFMVGQYVDGNNKKISGPKSGQLHSSSLVFYEASIDSYKVGGSNYYDPVAAGDFTDESFVFEGWFVDPGCTTRYNFASKKMPANGLTVYAKFRQREYRVFLEPNLPTDPNFSVDWASEGQQMNFRIAYQGVISDGQPIEATDANGGWVLVGWYKDKACTDPFNFSEKLTDALAVEYPKTEPTEPDNSNGDVGRAWINKKIVLYAEWRKVLSGANGITVKYNAIEQANTVGKTGTFADEANTPTTWTDPLRYRDQANAQARSGSTPDVVLGQDGNPLPDQYQFLYWELLDRSGNPVVKDGETVKYYPGQQMDVDFAYAVEGPPNGSNAAASPMQIVPVYGTPEGSGLVQAGNGKTYQLLTGAPADWSGNYVITNGNNSSMYLLKGVTPSSNGARIESGSNCASYANSGASLSGTTLTNISNDYVFTVSASDSYYTIKSVATNAYYGMDSDSYLAGYTSYNGTYCDWTPAYSSSKFQFKNKANGSTPYFGWSTRNSYFWSASTSNANVLYLWKEVDSGSTIEDVWVETTEITPNEEYLIGVTDSSNNVYLILNYSQTGDHYYYTVDPSYDTDYRAFVSYYEGYTALAVFDSNGYVTGVNDSNATALSQCTWKFSSDTGGTITSTQSGTTYYLYGDLISGTYSGYTLYNFIFVPYTSGSTWVYNASTGILRTTSTDFSSSGYISPKYYSESGTNVAYGYYSTDTSTGGTVKLYHKAAPAVTHSLTIHYVYADGTQAAPDYTTNVAEGIPFSVESPEIEGYYAPDQAVISGNMGNGDLEYTVTYSEVGHYEWQPVESITPNKPYLIGFKVNGIVYLAVNYADGTTNSNKHYNDISDIYYGYTAPATLDTKENVIAVTGNATDLEHCIWLFSDATGGTINSKFESNYYLRTYRATNYADLYPDSTTSNGTDWVYSAHTLYRAVSGTNRYAQYYTTDGVNYMRVANSAGTNGYVQLYSQVWVEPVTTNYYTVTFIDDYDGKQIGETQTVEEGTNVTPPAPKNHESDDYYFIGWNLPFNNENDDGWIIDDNVEIRALYEFRKTGFYTVTFKDWNGRILQVNGQDTQVIAEGQPATAPANPSREGYTFRGWDKSFDSVTSNLVVKATYSKTVDKSYTVTLRAVYGPKEGLKDTHVTWYANNDTRPTVDNEGNLVLDEQDKPVYDGNEFVYLNSAEVVVNNGIDIEDQDSWDNLTNMGYQFLGWARLPEMADQVHRNTPWFDGKFVTAPVRNVKPDASNDPEAEPTYSYTTKIIAYSGLTEKDLWLVYQPAADGSNSGGTFTAHDRVYDQYGNLVTDSITATGLTNDVVEQIGANENQPYHGLYAVWKRDVFYVVHSSNGRIEAINMPIATSAASVAVEQDGTTSYAYDLTKLVSSGYLYGGYYTEYGGVKDADALRAMADSYQNGTQQWTVESVYDGNPVNGKDIAAYKDASSCVATYNGSSLYYETTVTSGGTTETVKTPFWNYKKACTVNGTAMTPEANAIYFLKEIPMGYLMSKYLYVYEWKDLNNTEAGRDHLIDIFLVTAIDDFNYSKIGFRTVAGDKVETVLTQTVGRNSLTTKFTVTQKGNNTQDPVTHNFTAQSTFGVYGVQSGYVAIKKISPDDVNGVNVMLPTVTTYDGVTVSCDPIGFNVNKTDVEVTTKRFNMLYINFDTADLNWTRDRANVALWMWGGTGNTSTWVTPKPTHSGNIGWIQMPDNAYTSCKVLRFNSTYAPSGTAWGDNTNSNKWNETNNIDLSGYNAVTANLLGGYKNGTTDKSLTRYIPLAS